MLPRGDIPSPPPTPRDAPILRMRTKLAGRIHASKVQNGSFWCEEDLQQLWSHEEELVEGILGFKDPVDFKRAQREYFKVLSLLVYIDCFEQPIFETRFLRTPNRANKDLPFDLDWLSDALGQAKGQLFYDSQFMTIPIHIEDEETAKIRPIETGRRWPFEQVEEQIGIGGYGTVYRAEIPPRYLRNKKEGSSNDTTQIVAFKRLHQAQDGMVEVKNTNFLKEGLASHSAIAIHIAAMIQGSQFFIFFKYAELGNLEDFLSHSTSPEDQYDFSKRFPEYSMQYSMQDLMEQMKNLLGALKFLHGELQITGSPRTYCRHMDLRPSNILIFAGGRVGTWKISDFGISIFKSHVKALRDLVTPSEDASGTPMNLIGAHFAPELHPHYVEKISDTKSDVWSYGCIFVEVLAFALGAGSAVQTFRECRFEDRNDWFYKVLDRRKHNDNRLEHLASGTKQFVLKPRIATWIQGLSPPSGFDARKLQGYRELANAILVPNFHKRLSSVEAYNFLNQLDLPQESRRKTGPAVFVPGSWNLSLPNRAKVVAWDLSSNGESAAFLFTEDTIHFPLTNKEGLEGEREKHFLDLRKLKRLKLKVAGPFTLLIGWNEVKGKFESWLGDIHRVETADHIPVDSVDFLADHSMSDLSCRGVLALVYLAAREIRLIDIRSEFMTAQRIRINEPYNVHKLSFNATGRLLFVWLRAEAVSDQLRIYEVSEKTDLTHIEGPLSTYKIQWDHSPGLGTRLIPCFGESLAIVSMENGKIFLPQVVEGRPVVVASAQRLQFSEQLVQFAATDFALISLCRSSLRDRLFGSSKSGLYIQERAFVREEGLWAVSSTALTWKDRDGMDWATEIKDARLAVQDSDGRQVLVLCNEKGEVERLSRSFTGPTKLKALAQ